MKTLASLAVLAICGGTALAQTRLTVHCINVDSEPDCESVESQLLVDVSIFNGDACFFFRNAGSEESSIARIYFDDNSGILSGATIVNGPGVHIEDTRTPGPLNLPGGNTVGFEATSRFVAVQPPPQNGVNPGEHVRICFDVPTGTTERDLRLMLSNGTIRIGMHVIAHGGSYINDPVCLADYNADGFANSNDLFVFLADFFALSPRADINADGMVDSRDFAFFITLFFTGCPSGV